MKGKRRTVLLTALAATGLFGWYQSGTNAVPGSRWKLQDSQRNTGKNLNSKNADRTALGQQVEAARVRVAADGHYACCIKPACSWCLLKLDKCVCVMGVGSGRGACRECHGGWEAGQGNVRGKTKEDVRQMATFETASDHEGENKTEQVSNSGEAEQPLNGPEVTGRVHRGTDGSSLFRSNNCLNCHKMAGKGGTSGPDLTHEATRHADIDWQVRHLKDPSKVTPGSAMPSYAKLGSERLKALAGFLATRK